MQTLQLTYGINGVLIGFRMNIGNDDFTWRGQIISDGRVSQYCSLL